MYKSKILALLLTVSIIGCSFISTTTANANEEREMTTLYMLNRGETSLKDGNSVITVKKSTEENYLRSLAEKEGKSYEEVKEEQESRMGILVEDEELRYTTLESTKSIAGKNISTIIAVEVSYVFSNATNRAVGINGVGNPYIRISGPVTSSNWDGSADPNIYWDKAKIRISWTGSAYVEVTKSVGASLKAAGWVDVSIAGEETQRYWSPVVTQVANWTLANCN